MRVNISKTLEFDRILDILAGLALSEKIKEKIISIQPYMKETDVLKHMEQTTQGKAIIENAGNPPLAAMTNLEKVLGLVEQQAVLTVDDLNYVSQFISACKRMKAYLNSCESVAPDITAYAGSINDLAHLQDEIVMSIKGSVLDDRASAQLARIRRKMLQTREQIKTKVNQVLSSNRSYLSENFVSYKDGHYALPVKAQFKNKINGNVIDMSRSGGTYFIEPASVANLQSKIELLEMEEENEAIRILCALTELVEENIGQIKVNIEAMELLDFIFAKAKLSLMMKGIPATVVTTPEIIIKGGKHPFINDEDVVPLDYEMNNYDKRCVVITGPNTGGKTVVLKTVGLFSIMTQCGLHVPADEATISMHNMVLCDIGDGQSITENLSTFSSHITNIIEIVKRADEQSLVILDELGSGTDPTEGMGIAIAILEELAKKNCLLLATTHYPEVKSFARNTEGFINARMAFDKENMLPMYKLEIGEAGESCALYIAKRLGLPQRMIERAHRAAYTQRGLKENNIPYDVDVLSNAAATEKESIIVKQSLQKKDVNADRQKAVENKFGIGDSVIVYPDNVLGLVYQKANAKGEFGVMIKKEKHLINHKRLKLSVPASELYPEDYDMSIVFDTVANRKARHTMGRKHDPDAIIELRKGE